MTSSKDCTPSAGSVRSKKSLTQLCFWPMPRSPRVKSCTWMAARTPANGDRQEIVIHHTLPVLTGARRKIDDHLSRNQRGSWFNPESHEGAVHRQNPYFGRAA